MPRVESEMGGAGSARPRPAGQPENAQSSSSEDDPDFELGDLRDQDVDDEDANLLDAEDEELMRHLFENMDEDGGDEDDDDSDDEEGDDEGEDDDDDDDDDEAAEEEEDIDMQDSRLAWLGIRAGHRFTRQLARFQKLSTCTLESLGHGPAQLVNNSTAAVNARHCQTKDDNVYAQCTDRPKVMNSATMLRRREQYMGSRSGFSPAQRCHLGCFQYLPNRPSRIIDRMQSRVYIGNFSAEGNVFVAGFQHERRVRLYDTDNDWRLRKDVEARNLRWTITDTCISPDQKFLLYASISPIVHMVNLGSTSDAVESVANVTDVHEAMLFHADDELTARSSFGIWSLRWSPDGREVIAGTGDSSLYIYDVEQQKTTTRVKAHQDDVNAVTFVDDAPNIIVTGSDDALMKVWDRRDLRSSKPAGLLVGHTDGLTHLDPKGDGRYLISNCKDQTIKLWDLRNMMEANAYDHQASSNFAFRWDYRWEDYPAREYLVKHPQDNSLMTYRGHHVLATLIRAYFSPLHSTAQRYIYAGSHDGTVYIYDVVTGKVASKLEYHREVVRDCHWHPHLPMLVTTSFDGSVVEWDVRETDIDSDARGFKRKQLPRPGRDQLEDY